MANQNSNQRCEGRKDGGICQNIYRYKFNFDQFLSSTVKL